MTDKFYRSGWGLTYGNESLEKALARTRTEPDYTMGVLAEETGVPPDTLRSWERRHGFPAPTRSESNYRLYSERDIVAVTWLREQTDRGQGISEAISMLRRNLPGDEPDETSGPSHVDGVTVAHMSDGPFNALANALQTGDLPVAQARWDDLVISLSPAATGVALLRLQQRLKIITPHVSAFLLRKATVLLDCADPDIGRDLVVILTSGADRDQLPATIIGAELARAEFRILTPFADASSLQAVSELRQSGASRVVLVNVPDQDAETLRGLAPDTAPIRWQSAKDGDPGNQIATVFNAIKTPMK